jgi:hypothetical protein
MSFLRAIFSRRAVSPMGDIRRPDPARCSSLFEYSYRLMQAGVPTDQAETLVRDAQRRATAQAMLRPSPDPERPAERLARRQEGHEVAARVLLARVGAEDPDADILALYGYRESYP